LSDEQEIRDAVDAAKARGTFNIVNVLAERAYPKSSIVIHLDEQSAYDASVIKEELDELLERVGKHNPSKQQQDRIDDLTEQVDKLSQKMVEKRIYFSHQGNQRGKT